MPSFAAIVMTLAATSVAVFALPQAGVSNSCASGSTAACCSSGDSEGGILGTIFGGACLVPSVASGASLCSGQNTYCCPVNGNDGLLDASAACSPISG